MFCLIFTTLHSQGDVLALADSMPKFPGGDKELAYFIQRNVIYPPMARENNENGKVYVKFVVDTTGKVMNPVVLKSSGYKSLDNEAINVVSKMPAWEPGIDKGKKVKVSVNVPVTFKNLGLLNAPPEGPKLSPEQQEKHDKAMEQWNAGHKLESQGEFAKALEKFDNSLSIETNNKYALFDKGKMHMVLGEKDKACGIWNKMITDFIRRDEAEEFVKKYCGNPNGVEEMKKYYSGIKASGFFQSGMSDVNNGRYESALRKFDSTLKYAPERKDALFNKGLMHHKLDQKNMACTSWKKLLAIYPEDKQTAEVIKKHCN